MQEAPPVFSDFFGMAGGLFRIVGQLFRKHKEEFKKVLDVF
jgi:hypothetical protein